jgi:thiol-disulfide isomerase/thioredoxin
MEDSENLDSTPSSFISNPPPSKKRFIIPIVVILAVVIVSLMAVKASFQKQIRSSHQRVELTEGNEVPDLLMVGLDKQETWLSSLPHKVMLINFWATWCEACMEEMPSLVQLRDQYASKGFEVLGVNVDDNPIPVAANTATKLGIKFPIFTDRSNSLSDAFDLHAIPLTVIVNKNHKILMVESGGRDWNSEEIHQLIEKWLNES